jgi:hypothetical protein
VENILEIPNDIIEGKKKDIDFLKPTYLIDGDISLYKSLVNYKLIKLFGH